MVLLEAHNLEVHKNGLQPASCRAETGSPGLLLLSSPGGQKALEPLCQRRSGRGISLREIVAAPKTRKRKGTRRKRQRGHQQTSGRPKPGSPPTSLHLLKPSERAFKFFVDVQER